MAQTLPEGASISPADIDRIAVAQNDLLKTKNAHGSVNVRVNLHVHYEYPKHITVGEETVVVKSQAEELALSAPSAEDLDKVADEQKATEATTKTSKKKVWASA